MRWLVLVAIVNCLTAPGCGGCNKTSSPQGYQPLRVDSPQRQQSQPLSIVEVTDQWGLDFVNDGAGSRQFFYPSVMGSGAALLDCDNDGDLDIFLLNGQVSGGPRGTLLRQESGGLVDVTQQSGLIGSGYAMGVAAGDVDNDGDVDLFITGYGDNQLFLNRGDGTFHDASQQIPIGETGGDPSDVDRPDWGTAVAMVDIDRNGWLDLVIGHYLEYDMKKTCRDENDRLEFCGPKDFPAATLRLLLNRGSERGALQWEDATNAAKLHARRGTALGLVVRDFDEDGRVDIFVANDGLENHLWLQQPDGTFVEEGEVRGIATNRLGQRESDMGVVCDDLDQDGRFDVFVTHLRNETNTLWRGLPGGRFTDETPQWGLGTPALASTGFGTVAIDVDLDNDLDLLIANGHVTRGPQPPARDPGDFWRPYADRNHVFLQHQPGRFEMNPTSEFTAAVEVSRGLVVGDLDGDCVPELLVTNVGAPSRLFKIVIPQGHHALAVRAVDRQRQRDMVGARITVRVGDRRMVREILPHTSYLCSHEPTAFFGLANVDRYDEIIVSWPDANGTIESFPGGTAGELRVVQKGSGTEQPRAE